MKTIIENIGKVVSGDWNKGVLKADTRITLTARESSDWPKEKCKIAVIAMTAIYETITDDGFENFALRSKIIR